MIVNGEMHVPIPGNDADINTFGEGEALHNLDIGVETRDAHDRSLYRNLSIVQVDDDRPVDSLDGVIERWLGPHKILESIGQHPRDCCIP